MNETEKIQSAIETSRQEDGSDSPKWLPEGPKHALDYIDILHDKNSKLSGIINCLSRYSGEIEDVGDDFENLGRAMLDFTDSIECHVDGLYKHLGKINALTVDEINHMD